MGNVPIVLYIMGIYRSGTTILSNLAGQLSGFFCAGELRAMWREIPSPHAQCGCGEALEHCPVWAEILPRAFGSHSDRLTIAARMQQWQTRILLESHTWRSVPSLLRSGKEELRQDGALARYGAQLAELYRVIAEVTMARVVVDSSKEPTDAALLRLLPGISAYFVHIVRDPRGTVYSSLRREAKGDEIRGPHCRKSAYIASSWVAGNLARSAVRLAHYRNRTLFVRYEDFVADPKGTLAEIKALVGEQVQTDFIHDNRAVMRPTHTVAGNQNRFRTGTVRLQEDTEWMARLHPLDKATTTALCSPLLLHYGYPFLPWTSAGLTRS